MTWRGWRAAGLAVLVACAEGKDVGPSARLAELADPAACAECHPGHHREWSGSMHAYAAEDPVFRAMNARGQRETGGELGDFCVRCHAPLAVELGLTTDGLNLDEVPEAYRGVTCFFCHQADAVDGTHNNPLRLAWDGVMRGGIRRPVDNTFHGAAYSPLHDRDDLRSAELCGACHDIVNPLGVHIERTYAEWRDTLYAEPGIAQMSCGDCHMKGRDDVAADAPGVKLRRVKDHSMPGVDLALTDFPEREAQRELVTEELEHTVLARLCVAPEGGDAVISVTLHNQGAGHAFPSGAAADRRLWAEIVAYDGDEVIWSTGVVADDEPVAELDDPDLWLFRDVLRDESGDEVHMFWEAASYESQLLPGPPAADATAFVNLYPSRQYNLDVGRAPTRVTLRMRVRPMGLEVLDDLIESGDLDPAVRAEIPTLDLGGTVLEWTAETAVSSGDAPDFTCAPS